MPKFVKKPVEIEAIQFTGDNYKEIREFTKANSVAVWDGQVVTHLLINTLEGAMKAQVNDWIIRGVKGEYYPCKPDIFEATYDPVPQPEGRAMLIFETEQEVFDFAMRVYKEIGVTPELQRVYDFYKNTQLEPQPSTETSHD